MSWNMESARLYRIVPPFSLVASHADSFDFQTAEIMFFAVVQLFCCRCQPSCQLRLQVSGAHQRVLR